MTNYREWRVGRQERRFFEKKGKENNKNINYESLH